MRRATLAKSLIAEPTTRTSEGHLERGGQIIGINLGYSPIPEHGRGILGIKIMFGIPEKPKVDLVGAVVRTVTKVPVGLRLFPGSIAVYLVYSHRLCESKPTEGDFENWMEYSPGDGLLSTAWSDNEFAIRINKFDDEKKQVPAEQILAQIYQAFKQKNVVIFFGNDSNRFGDGLVIAIRSRLDSAVLRHMEQRDLRWLREYSKS